MLIYNSGKNQHFFPMNSVIHIYTQKVHRLFQLVKPFPHKRGPLQVLEPLSEQIITNSDH